MGCSKCGARGRYPTTMTNKQSVPRRSATAPVVRYTVNGRKFSTLTAAQDYAAQHPGSVIRQS